MKKKNPNFQNGQVLVASLFFMLILTLLVGMVGFMLLKEKKSFSAKQANTKKYYTAESAEQLARFHMSEFSKAKFEQLKNSWSGSSVSAIIPNTNEFFSGIENWKGKGQNQTFKTKDFLDSNLKTVNNSGESMEIKNPKKTRYEYYFFNDKNSNFQKDSDEENFYLINQKTDPDSQIYDYQFYITAYGFSSEEGIPPKKITRTGTIRVGASAGSFAKFSLFTGSHITESGGDIWFTDNTNFDGPVHTNGKNGSEFRFAGNSSNGGRSASFTGRVTSSNTNIQWYDGGYGKTTTPPLSDFNPKNGTKDVPVFGDGYERGVGQITLPDNSFNQRRAALGDDYTNTNNLTTSELNSLLGVTGFTTPDNIYVPNQFDNVKGGIYVKGDVDSLILSVNGDGNQQYTFEQNGKTKTITVDKASNETIITENGLQEVCTTTQQCHEEANCIDYRWGRCRQYGTPINVCEDVTECHMETTPPVTTVLNGVLNGALHVDGEIKFLGGPPRNPSNSNNPADAGPAIQSNTELTISSTGDIIIQRDIKYQTNPLGADGLAGTPDDVPNAKNVLGLFTSGGDVRIGSSAPRDVNVHASIMASSEASGNGAGVFKVDSYDSRSDSGAVHLVGGVITGRYGAFGTFSSNGSRTGFGRDFVYDRRFQNGKSPPFFPTVAGLDPDPPQFFNEVWNEERL